MENRNGVVNIKKIIGWYDIIRYNDLYIYCSGNKECILFNFGGVVVK